MQFEIKNCWSGRVQYNAEIECSADASTGVKIGLAVLWAIRSGANLSGANLSGADLSGAPVIPDIHKAVYAAASAPGALNMSTWHSETACGTAHCRAGWVVALAGQAGRRLEAAVGTPAAATARSKAAAIRTSSSYVQAWTRDSEGAPTDV